MISIIVPAHNEEAVLARGLRAIVTGAQPDELEVIVACNGCTDGTAEIARGFGPPVRVIEIDQASKTVALNAGDELAAGFPRFYVDADVILNHQSVMEIAETLERGNALFATPSLRMNLSRASWPVRAFYRVWTELPYNRAAGQVGTGVYALSRTGRERFAKFPDVTNDDGFVRLLFAKHERLTVSSAVACVDAPQTLTSLLRIKTRVRRGQRELCQYDRARRASESQSLLEITRFLIQRSSLVPCIPVYLFVAVYTRVRARQHYLSKTPIQWDRDSTAR